MPKTLSRIFAVVLLLGLGLYLMLRIFLVPEVSHGKNYRVAQFSHVFIIVMENHGTQSLIHNPNTPYIDRLMTHYGLDTQYDGITHPSLPNYLGLISGSTQGQLTDNPKTTFRGPTLVTQLRSHHKTWQAVMQSIPSPGYSGAWYPDATASQSILAPPNALYAKKHDPFQFFDSISHQSLIRHTRNLRAFETELKQGKVPNLIFITPNLCHDMHGQPNQAGASCPTSQGTQLEQMGNKFLATWVPRIQNSSSWSGNAVIFILWDEANFPTNLAGVAGYLRGAPGTPRILGIPLGGGSVPLIVIDRQIPRPQRVNIVCNHYCVLKTIQSSWRLGYLGATQNPAVKTLVPLVPAAP